MGIEGRPDRANPLGPQRTAASARRARRELKTVGAMIALYCRDHHGTQRELCADCDELLRYAGQRTEHCPLIADKPTCAHCPVHCYKPAMRERIRTVMRYAGPRMMWRHPILTILHLVEGWRDRSRKGLRPRPSSRDSDSSR